VIGPRHACKVGDASRERSATAIAAPATRATGSGAALLTLEAIAQAWIQNLNTTVSRTPPTVASIVTSQ
jgi:hypothetical protein